MERKTLMVDITLTDGTELKKCAIFNGEPKHGDESLTTTKEINDAFNKILWGKKFVAFQNELINGYVHVNNVKGYEITE
jgi:hypothetical protein